MFTTGVLCTVCGAQVYFHLSSRYIFLFKDCTAISDMAARPFLTLRDAETSVLWKT